MKIYVTYIQHNKIMHKILSRNIIIYLLSHPMSAMINLHNLQNMIWTNLYQEILSSSTNIRDKSVKWHINKTYHTIKCFVIQHKKKCLKHKMTYKYKWYVTIYNNNCNTYIPYRQMIYPVIQSLNLFLS